MRTKEIRQYTKWLKLFAFTCAVVGQVLFFQSNVILSYAQTIGTITASTANIRQSPDSSSSAIAGVEYGDEVDVTAQTTGTDTYTWYKVLDGGNVGYIRADLISVEDSVPVETSTTSTDTSSSDTSSSDTSSSDTSSSDVTESQVATAKVIVSSVNVRASADTSASKQGGATIDTIVNVTGEVMDSDGATWYQVSFDSDGTTVNGYIRSDFLEVVDMVVVEEETSVDESVATEEESTVVETSDEYSLAYIENSEGVMDWYLYDNNNGIKQSLTDMLDYIEYTQETRESEQSQLQIFKIALIVAVVVIVILIIVLIVIILKYRDVEFVYEEDEEVAEEQPRKKKPQREEARYMETASNVGNERRERPRRNTEERSRFKESIPNEVVKNVKTDGKQWESKNFLEVDDDMEFEFLDIKK